MKPRFGSDLHCWKSPFLLGCTMWLGAPFSSLTVCYSWYLDQTHYEAGWLGWRHRGLSWSPCHVYLLPGEPATLGLPWILTTELAWRYITGMEKQMVWPARRMEDLWPAPLWHIVPKKLTRHQQDALLGFCLQLCVFAFAQLMWPISSERTSYPIYSSPYFPWFGPCCPIVVLTQQKQFAQVGIPVKHLKSSHYWKEWPWHGFQEWATASTPRFPKDPRLRQAWLQGTQTTMILESTHVVSS